MKIRSLSLLLAAVMLLGTFPALGSTVYAADTSEGKVVIDYDCSSVNAAPVYATGNNYPSYYFTDSKTEGVAEGTVYAGSDGETTGYSTLFLPFTMDQPSFSLEMDVKVDDLMTPSGNHIWRGLVFEINLPNGSLVYVNFHSMTEPDADGKNALMMGMTKERSDPGLPAAKIAIPTDGEFHKWTLQFNGQDEVYFYIDGELQASYYDVTAKATGTAGTILIKNVMHDIQSGKNSVTFDHIKMTSGIKMEKREVLNAVLEPGAVSSNFTLHTEINKLYDDSEITFTVTSRDDASKVYTHTYKPTDVKSSVTVSDIPFGGMCTVCVNVTGGLREFTFDHYLYSKYEAITAGASITADTDLAAYRFDNLHTLELPKGSKWAPGYFQREDGSYGSTIYCPGVKADHAFNIPVKLNGKFAVYVGCVQGTRNFTVNGQNVFVTHDPKTGNTIREAFAIAGDFKNEEITISNTQASFARLAYVKFVSISDETYEKYVAEDDSRNLMMDNDGFSMFTNTKAGTVDYLLNTVVEQYAQGIGLGKYNFATWVTSLLNFPSETQKTYIEKRLKELNVPEEKWPKHFLDQVDKQGNPMDFSDLMRNADQNAFDNITAINETGIPHVLLADYIKKNDYGELYVSQRMSAYYSGIWTHLNGTFFFLHPEWQRGGSYQFSYMHEEYRNYMHDLLMEMASPENVSGITMDFGRYYYIFGTELTDVSERTKIMNDFVKSVSEDLPEGKILNARVLNPTEEKAELWGLDYKTWVKEGWIDRLIISDQGHETFFDLRPYMEFMKENEDVEIYIGINSSLSGHDRTKEEEEILAAGGTVESGERVSFLQFMLRAYDIYMAGADGVFIFNGLNNSHVGGIDPAYGNMNNKTSMVKWYTFNYPAHLFSETVSFLNAKDVPEEFKNMKAPVETTAADTSAPAETDAPNEPESGNLTPVFIAVGAVAVIAIAAVAIVLKKKKKA